MYIYIYIERERERFITLYVCTYIYIYICTYIYTYFRAPAGGGGALRARRPPGWRGSPPGDIDR